MTTPDATFRPRGQQAAVMDWPWKREDPGTHIILVSDEQLINLANYPDEAVEKIFPQEPGPVSLREHCRRSAERGATKLRVAFDYFFGGSDRSLYPDTEAFMEALKKIHDVAQEYGIGLEPSIISPLELGVGYREKTGESGRWMHYREGLRDPETGMYSVMVWQQTRWCNNKGPIPVKLVGVRAFAFREERVPGTPFFAVEPSAIVELETPEIETLPGAGVDVGMLDGGVAHLDAMFQAVRIRVHAAGGPQGLDRVLIVLLYETVEMDYFSPSASAFLDELVHTYHDRGITLSGIYSDEMHIQQDWSYHSHFDNGQFTVRYVSPGFERAFAEAFGSEYGDFAPYMLYFASHQHDFLATHEPKLPSQHVFGSSEEAIAATLKFRRNYYHFLESAVVDLMIDAREKLEALNGHELDAFYHSTWAESPTCDAWTVGGVHQSWSPEEHRRRYAYTPDFLWSNTIQQAAAACANYFLWNDFLTGGNNDTAEGGYADRNYYGRALACSLAALNRRPLASAGMWGMPPAVRQRMTAVSAVFGAGGHPAFHAVEDYAPRQCDVLFLYPQDLVAVEERFGSWIVLYGYANYATAEKLVEFGWVTETGLLAVKDARYRAVAVLYEPFPSAELLVLLRNFAERGGTVIWSGTPPLEPRGSDDLDVRGTLEDLCGVRFTPTPDPLGLSLPARRVTFQGALAGVPWQTVMTDFVVDRVFPLKAREGVDPVAVLRSGGPEGVLVVGTRRVLAGGGQVVTLGFRPEDDQSASTGVEIRTWYEILRALGAYPGDDHPVALSRTTEYLAATFPNGAVALCPHYRHHPESWPGGFYRDPELDRELLEANPVPDDAIKLDEFVVAGQRVSYVGRHAVAWRYDGADLIAFSGVECTGIDIDGTRFAWSETEVDVAWHPLGPAYTAATVGAAGLGIPLYRVWVGSIGTVCLPIPLPEGDLQLWRGAYAPGSSASSDPAQMPVGYVVDQVPFEAEPACLRLKIDERSVGHWLYVIQ
jgi:hypothetical protein